METHENFKNIFWDAFHRPKLETEKYQQLWTSLEPLNDRIAGPFYSIYTNGHCDYVFKEKHRFQGISDADELLDYCSDIIKSYHEEIMKTIPETDAEKADQRLLLYQVDMKMELAHLAYQIQKERINPQDME